MAKLLGNNYRLYIQSATAGTYNPIGGQGDLSYSRKAQLIDVSDKNNAPYGLKAAGNFDVEISMSGIPDLPDANGLSRAETMFKTQAIEKYQIRKAPFATGDVIFEGSCYTNDCSVSFPKDAPASYTLALGLAAAPTTDLLA